nr:MAG TPA: hypothetical protein [Caudoviricetes sp.]
MKHIFLLFTAKKLYCFSRCSSGFTPFFRITKPFVKNPYIWVQVPFAAP